MGKVKMGDLLHKRIAATQQSSELQIGEEAYQHLFQTSSCPVKAKICELPIDCLKTFYTADIGFHPYPPKKLQAFSEQLSEEGLFDV